MKVTVDAKLCQGHGLCYVSAPGVFEDDDIGHAIVRSGVELVGDLLVAAERAALQCPEQAIALES